MNKLDAELQKALEEPSKLPPASSTHATYSPPRSQDHSEKKVGGRPSASAIGLLIALVAIVGVVITVFMFGFKDAAIYSLPVAELTANTQKYVGRKIRVEGELHAGSLVKRDQPCEYRFTMQGMGPGGDAHKVPVRYGQCVVPDTFRDAPGGGVQVTVEGTLTTAGHFEATLVMAKCSSKYDPQTHEMKPGQAESANTPIN